MSTENKQNVIQRKSLTMHSSVADAIKETGLDENRSFSAQLKHLVHMGLEGYGKKVRGNRIIE